ncbi:hypothetical protein Pmar_PMAR010225 [Perkinsus marinus ATCC 50983]|uniref:Uncharacterized protein n=1 Tax=Perkinsus marinus (strain ATCC 50983 / TXsc) TaxID=423536 RepID=C5K562_PERM5|nr:hypothetical protein Pmar_PMAR010225 [Perkinsus marinus ATCC 50983]EER20484.1 hypothetical protein Pmar_PMAR010225 [Perkinsus marinus ATCC 50983]|eukprot:XP_002788688.1 hypothetical protein Pmar_PMAR010225 [Perkinsus marinus ATCC 50983]
MDSGKPPEGVLPSTVRGQMNKSDRSSRHRDAVSGMNGTMEEHRAGAEALRHTKGSGTTLGKEAWHPHKHPRKALVRGRIRKAHVNHQVEGNIMLAKLLIFLSVNSNGGPNDIITAPSEPDLGDLPNHDSLFLCNHVCWQRHPKGITGIDIKGSASVVTRCEVSPMADILFRRTKPSLLRSLARVCDEECIAMTAEDNSPISACVAVPCSERCRVEGIVSGTRCSATLEYDWCLWTRACDGCLKQEEPTTLGRGTLVTAIEMQCMNFDGECRPLGEFFPCAAPYFEEAFPYGPYYTTVKGKPYKEVRNIGVDWNNFTVAVEAVLHNHRGATPECFKARFLVVDSSREKKYRLEDRQWRSAICAEHWDDPTLPWEIDDRVVRGDFDGRIEDMFLFESDQNPGRPASVRVVGKVPLMRAAKDMNNVVHLTPDFNDYQVLLCLGPRSGYMSPLGDAALKVLGPWRLKLTNDLLETNVGIQRGKEEGIATEIPSPGMHTHGVLVP